MPKDLTTTLHKFRYRSVGILRPALWLLLGALIAGGVLRGGAVRADPIASVTATVASTGGLNLRSDPGISADIIAVLPDGGSVIISGSGTPDNWLPVQYNGRLGWVDGAYLSLGAGEAVPAVSTVAPSDGLNLRSGPGTGYGVLNALPAGTAFTVTGSPQNNWAPVNANGVNGWVDTAFIAGPGSGGTSPMITASAVAGSGGVTISATAGTGGYTSTAAAISTSAGATFAWPVDTRGITTLFSPAHLGLDIAQSSGKPIHAAAAGTVSFAGGNPCCSYGLYVIVDHAGGYQTLYGHMSSVSVKQGDTVGQGQQLGLVGCTGHCTGPHVHFEVRTSGTRVDPLRFLPAPWEIR